MEQNKSASFVMEVQRLIYKLNKSYELCEKLCIAEYNVTVSQSYTLLALPQEGSVSMNELSAAMGLANSTMTRMVDQLVDKGIVSRTPDDEDRRIVRVGLTSQGWQVQHSLEQAQQEFLEMALVEIQDDDRQAILRALDLVIQSIGKAIKSCFTD